MKYDIVKWRDINNIKVVDAYWKENKLSLTTYTAIIRGEQDDRETTGGHACIAPSATNHLKLMGFERDELETPHSLWIQIDAPSLVAELERIYGRWEKGIKAGISGSVFKYCKYCIKDAPTARALGIEKMREFLQCQLSEEQMKEMALAA